ncbi:hypothetical protein [Luteibacter sp.]|jgi:hypothetical protein|uniref:hypothetical protein n=1 Tax=Luteibacter sp. TaxID=1886636 RepID=UPI002F3F1458
MASRYHSQTLTQPAIGRPRIKHGAARAKGGMGTLDTSLLPPSLHHVNRVPKQQKPRTWQGLEWMRGEGNRTLYPPGPTVSVYTFALQPLDSDTVHTPVPTQDPRTNLAFFVHRRLLNTVSEQLENQLYKQSHAYVSKERIRTNRYNNSCNYHCL